MPIPKVLPAMLLALVALPASAASVTYEIDPSHTFASFEADHMGMSTFRGKFNRSSGQVVLDKAAGTGTLAVEIDVASIDFGQDELNALMAKPDYFDTAQHPTARYSGKLTGFVDGKPTQVVGALTLRGVTRPLTLEVTWVKSAEYPMGGGLFGGKPYVTGINARATLKRSEFGMTYAVENGLVGDAVTLMLGFEARRQTP